jgi:uncharacterized protein (TIGR02300 family)
LFAQTKRVFGIMKLEWGKKICCPACSLPFFDLQRTDILCPYCGSAFASSDLQSKKIVAEVLDDIALDDKLTEITGFDFPDESDSEIDLSDDAEILSVGDDIEDVDITN